MESHRDTEVWRVDSKGRRRKTNLACKNQDLESKFDASANHQEQTRWWCDETTMVEEPDAEFLGRKATKLKK